VSWRRASREDLPVAALWALGGACALATAPLLPYLASLAGPCALHTLTGVPCPTCGATRAAGALAHGHVAAAFAWNPLAALGMSVGLAGAPVAPAWVMLRGPLPLWRPGWKARVLVGAALAANWLYLVRIGR
jgi:hypothetical protein